MAFLPLFSVLRIEMYCWDVIFILITVLDLKSIFSLVLLSFSSFFPDLVLVTSVPSLRWFGNETMRLEPNLLTLCQLPTLEMWTFAFTISSKSSQPSKSSHNSKPLTLTYAMLPPNFCTLRNALKNRLDPVEQCSGFLQWEKASEHYYCNT